MTALPHPFSKVLNTFTGRRKISGPFGSGRSRITRSSLPDTVLNNREMWFSETPAAGNLPRGRLIPVPQVSFLISAGCNCTSGICASAEDMLSIRSDIVFAPPDSICSTVKASSMRKGPLVVSAQFFQSGADIQFLAQVASQRSGIGSF